ncbi:carboxypeptidase regulatory-like domain-containing protein [Planktothrix sp. FACHB-1355]|uniref:carboxypeptidase-like regulatory domain-containing protein n=1 Tax=Planktothrix sp. FACHB-1355 TaxID=2692854 RepID=UPI00168B30D4|nr:carboxypeptidase-like regulatory domain-containing protein [Planktothrix sp. FACHB-1355]MBD3557521.1 carboxypeptidase regulatory-like domain-containing protein [Planktothrix sp. FACHB-1355]MBD3885879.1 carboxypeptidase regulatory-like domain-containing protein [Phormidium tenue FACHB-886]
MKSKIVLFSILLFLTSTGAFAQPQCNSPFNPFNICNSNFEWYDYFFYGEIISKEKMPYTMVNSTTTTHKVVVKVKKSFKGELPEKVTLYLGSRSFCQYPTENSKYLFYANNSELDGRKVYFSEWLSRPMTDYSAEAVNEVFANIHSILRNEKRDYVEGGVYEFFSERKKISMKKEDADRKQPSISYSEPVANILIEAMSESDGKVYQTRSNADGTFRIDRIPMGTYKIKLYLPPDKVQVEPFRYGVSNNLCSRKWVIPVASKPSK